MLKSYFGTKWLFSFGSFFEYGTAMSFNLDITFTFFNFHSKYLETWSSLDPPLAQLTWEDERILRWGKGGLGECQELDLEIFQVSGCSWRSGQELCALQALPWRWPEKERFDCFLEKHILAQVRSSIVGARQIWQTTWRLATNLCKQLRLPSWFYSWFLVYWRKLHILQIYGESKLIGD